MAARSRFRRARPTGCPAVTTRLATDRTTCFFTMSDSTSKPWGSERIPGFFWTSTLDRGSQPHVPKGKWWSQTGSNRRPHACKARALPTELWPLEDAAAHGEHADKMVGLGRLERPTSPLSGVRSNHLSYRPQADSADQMIRRPGLVHEERETKTAASRLMLADLRAVSKSSESRTFVRRPRAC